VILINLLPHREAARKRRREIFYAALGASAFAGALIAGGIYSGTRPRFPTSRTATRYLILAEIKKLEAQIKDIATLQEEIAALRARQQAVEDLQADRNMPVHLLNELVAAARRRLPHQHEAETARVASPASPSRTSASPSCCATWAPAALDHAPELVEIVAGNIALSPKRDQRRVSNFKVHARASEAQKAASAACAASGNVARSHANRRRAVRLGNAAVAACRLASAKK
jgi:type IV pilus assembly protein PilN